MALYHRKGSTYELLIHHSMVILCFGIAVSTRTYVAYAALSLVVEINSVFLHARQLLTIGGISKSSSIYRLAYLIPYFISQPIKVLFYILGLML